MVSPVAQANGHDEPRPIRELVLCIATVIENVLVGCEHPVGHPVLAHEPPDMLHRIELSDFGGSGSRVMFLGTASLDDMCQPA